MAVQIIHKNSSVAGKPVSSSQIAYGELAINYNENGPFLQVRASDDEIWSVGGVTIGTDAPGSPLEGAFWYNEGTGQLFLFANGGWRALGSGGGGGGGSGAVDQLIGGNAIDINPTGGTGTVTLNVDYSDGLGLASGQLVVSLEGGTDDGLEFDGGDLKVSVATASALGGVKVGSGLDVNSSGTISVSAGAGGAVTGITEGNGISVTGSAPSPVVAVDLDSDATRVGLQFDGNELQARLATETQVGSIKVGEGLNISGGDTLNVDEGIITGMQYKGTVDLRAAKSNTNPAPNADVKRGWTYVHESSSGAGAMDASWQTATGESVNVSNGDLVIASADNPGNGDWTLIQTSGTNFWSRDTSGTAFLEPATSGDNIFTTGDVNVGGTATAATLRLTNAGNVLCTGGYTDGDGISIFGTSPSTQVVVRGDSTAATTGAFMVYRDGNAAGNITSRINHNGTATFEGTVTAGSTSGTEVGINANPAGALTVKNASVSAGSAILIRGGIGTANVAGNISLGANGDSYFGVAPSTANSEEGVRIEGSSGNVRLYRGGFYAYDNDGNSAKPATTYTLSDGTAGWMSNNVRLQSTGSGGQARPQYWMNGASTLNDEANAISINRNSSNRLNLLYGGGATFSNNVVIGGSGTTTPNTSYYLLVNKSANETAGTGAIAANTTMGSLGIPRNSTAAINAGPIGVLCSHNITSGQVTGISHLKYFQAAQQANGAGNVTNQYGYYANANLNGASSNYGFYSELVQDGTNDWNFYASGTAPNFFAGRIIQGNSNTDFWQRPDTQAVGVNLVTNSLTADTSALEITSHNSANNNQRTAILFTKADKDEIVGSANFLATAGSIEITDGIGANAGLIYNCGATTAANGFVSTSDYRLKENFASLDNAVDRVKLLQPKRFNYIGDAETVDGFIAHEMEAACPAAVFGAKDATEAIGTLRDALGNILEENVTEPSAEEMTYEEQIEVSPYVAPAEAVYSEPELIKPATEYKPAVLDEEGNEIEFEVPATAAVYSEPELITPATEEQEAVYETVTKQRTWEATGTRPVYQGVDQSKLIPLLTKALQEALERIEVLEELVSSSAR